jgi:hypothetical protein
MAAEAGAGPSRLERLEEKVGDYKIKDRLGSKRNKEAIELMKAQVDYGKKKTFGEAFNEKERAFQGQTEKNMAGAIQDAWGKIPTTVTTKSQIDAATTLDNIGEIFILKTKNEDKTQTYTIVKIIENNSGQPSTEVVYRR